MADNLAEAARRWGGSTVDAPSNWGFAETFMVAVALLFIPASDISNLESMGMVSCRNLRKSVTSN